MTMKKQQQQTPEERIAAMRATVQARKDREALERQRQALRKQAAYQAAEMFVEALSGLSGLPVTPSGEVAIFCIEEGGPQHVRVVRKYVASSSGQAFSHEVLIQFGVEVGEDLVEGEEFEWWPTHDGERVTGEIALDLATAAVEARFHCE